MLDTLGPDGPPRRMGRYELLFRIASGGMAEVYAARVVGEAGFEKLVAVKRMLPTLAEDEEFVRMFLDEARVAANISNAHVVQTLDLGRDSFGALYIVMELVVGVTLSRILKEAAKVRRAVPVGMAVELIAQAADGLHAAHEATTPVGEPLHIVHRDVSPQNILVGIDGRVRITDFGVARAVARMTQTQAGRIKGKFAYCSPEQLLSADVDRRADVFALGVVAWETMAGQRLFVADHPLAIMERVRTMPILPVNQVRTKVPGAIADVVDRALQRDPEARFPTAGAFAEALRRAARAAKVERPEQSEARRFVQGAGGEPLRKIRSNIQRALALGDGADGEVEATETLSHISETGTLDTDLEGHDPGQLSVREADASALHSSPGSLMPPPPAPPAQPETEPDALPRAWVYGGAAVAVALLAALVAFVVLSPEAPSEEGEAGIAQPAAPPETPVAAEPPTPEPTEPPAVTEAAGEPEPAAEVEAEEPTQAADTTANEEPARATRRRSRRSTTTGATEMQVATTMATDRPRAAPERETPMEAAPTTAEMASSSSMSLLMGLEAFDEAMGQ